MIVLSVDSAWNFAKSSEREGKKGGICLSSSQKKIVISLVLLGISRNLEGEGKRTRSISWNFAKSFERRKKREGSVSLSLSSSQEDCDFTWREEKRSRLYLGISRNLEEEGKRTRVYLGIPWNFAKFGRRRKKNSTRSISWIFAKSLKRRKKNWIRS